MKCLKVNSPVVDLYPVCRNHWIDAYSFKRKYGVRPTPKLRFATAIQSSCSTIWCFCHAPNTVTASLGKLVVEFHFLTCREYAGAYGANVRASSVTLDDSGVDAG